MRKKVLLVPLSLFTLAMSACGNNGSTPEPTKHIHHYDVENIDWCYVPNVQGGYSASASFTCHECTELTEGHEVEIPAGVTVSTLDPTCTVDGATIYTATVDFEGKQYQDEKRIPIKAGGHHYEETWSFDNTSHFHKCEDCDAKIDTENHVSISGVKYDEIYHWRECAICKNPFEKEVHTLNEVIADKFLAAEPTCYTNKLYYKSCETCGNPGGETFEVPNTMLEHSFTHHTAVDPIDCKNPGHKEYYTCDHCPGKYFANNTDKHAQPVSWDSLIVRAPHDMHLVSHKDPKCDENGCNDHYECSYESDVYYKNLEGTETYTATEVIIPMTGHEFNYSGQCRKCSKTITQALGLTETTVPTVNTNEVLLMNDSNTIFGKKVMSPNELINLPNLEKENCRFLGWFDANGNKWSNGDAFVTKMILTARFVEQQDNMFVPSDFGYETTDWADISKDQYNVNSLMGIDESAESLHMYLMYDATKGLTSGDTYFIIDFPASDSGVTTVHLRIDTRSDVGGSTQIRTFFYGAGSSSIGGAKEENKHFMNMKYAGTLLVHMYVIKGTGSNNVTAGYEITSMCNGAKDGYETAITFASDYSITNVATNKLGFNRAQDMSKTRIKDAF